MSNPDPHEGWESSEGVADDVFELELSYPLTGIVTKATGLGGVVPETQRSRRHWRGTVVRYRWPRQDAFVRCLDHELIRYEARVVRRGSACGLVNKCRLS
ncbi:MAG: hypothetical protein KTR25_01270 [Myxococcales bacterium]|nr:hypothetical protein [Myxococcales bacterium]